MNDDTRAKLHQDLPANAVRTRDQAGAKLSYIDGHFAITRANEVFGHDGWSLTVRSMSEVYRGTRPGRDAGSENIVIVYEAHVAVTALGITREDVGIGQCDASLKALAGGIEKGRKEAVTDGLKRALRTFGASFGLALYDKTQADVGASFAAQACVAALDAATDAAALDAAKAGARAAWPELPADERELVTARMKAAEKRVEKAAPKTPPEGSPAARPALPPGIETDSARTADRNSAARADSTRRPSQPLGPDDVVLMVATEATPDGRRHVTDIDRVNPDAEDPGPADDVAQVAPAEMPPALASFYEHTARIELPGEAVAVWMKHREAVKAQPKPDARAAWDAIVERVMDVGRMGTTKAAKAWLERAVKDEDARRTVGAADHQAA